MHQIRLLVILVVSVAGLALPLKSSAAAVAADLATSAEEFSQIAARLIAEAIPREYERSQDWGRTKPITTGLRSSGNFFKFDIHRRRSDVKHGVWKRYRVALIEPEKNLLVRIENLRTIGPGRYALTLFVSAKLHGWVRAKVYERGIHLIALEAEGDGSVQLSLDVEISLETIPTDSWVPGIAVRPVITGARLDINDLRLTRISDVRGPIVRELGDGLRHLVEDELAGPKLVAKLNRSIEKRRDRLQLTPDRMLGRQ